MREQGFGGLARSGYAEPHDGKQDGEHQGSPQVTNMALEIVWRNPRSLSDEEDIRNTEDGYCGMSLCIVRTVHGEVIFQIDKGQSPRKIMEVRRAGGA